VVPKTKKNMNVLQRALIEKAGHDNGWEVKLDKSADSVTLGSSQHDGSVRVSCLLTVSSLHASSLTRLPAAS
jgi:hypothetical protein